MQMELYHKNNKQNNDDFLPGLRIPGSRIWSQLSQMRTYESRKDRDSEVNMMNTKQVGLFFYVNGKFLLHNCDLKDAENYGNFLIYPESHFDIWNKLYYSKFYVDFDFFPRGRIAYRKSDNTFLIYYDKCLEHDIDEILNKYIGCKTELSLDEHYQCHRCNSGYIR